LHFSPTCAIITNIELDHTDYFKSEEALEASFLKSAEGAKRAVVSADYPISARVARELGDKAITVGRSIGADYRYEPICADAHCSRFKVYLGDSGAVELSVGVPGQHNVSNALAVIAAARKLGISMEQIQAGLLGFSGANRRFQRKGEYNGVTIIDDYAHHPTEIRTTLEAAKNYPNREVWCIFQPHTYTRTKAFFHEFAESLSLADHVILAEIYAARETDTLGMSSALLCEEIKKLGADCHYFPTFAEIEDFVKSHCIHGDLLITMGAGDVVNIGENILNK
jgi:UDP-N-acetylmuramate--alanine ligase